MSSITRDELKSLLAVEEKPAVSIFMPTHQLGSETQQDPIRLKNLADQAEEQLVIAGLRAPEARALLEPARALLDDHPFWQHQQAGLAVFLTPNQSDTYRLPLTVEERVVVGDRFHLKPLLALLSGRGRFYLLALSQNEVRLFEGTPDQINDVELEEIPESLAEALRFDEFLKQQQWHTGTPDRRGKRPAIFHGQGVGVNDKKENILRFFQQLDRGLQTVLPTDHTPLMLAGVEYLLPIYRQANSYSDLLAQGLTGNPEELSAQELHQQAWAVVEPHFRQAEAEARSAYQQLAHTDQASAQLREVLIAAYQGRVGSLFVATDEQRWGAYDFDTDTLTLHNEPQPGDEDLLDTAAIQTLLHDGAIYVVESPDVPADSPLAAVFRY